MAVWAALWLAASPLLGASPALAADLMLKDDTPPSYTGIGWSALGLSLLSAAYAVNQYQESQDELDKADKAYDDYKAAADQDTAIAERDRTERHHDKAVAAEERANVAILATLVLAATAYYSFTSDPYADQSLLTMTPTGILYRVRF